MNANKAQESNAPEGITLTEFLESVPPGQAAVVTDAFLVPEVRYEDANRRLKLPTLHLHWVTF